MKLTDEDEVAVAVDYGEQGRAAIDAAATLAARFGCRLRLVHAFVAPGFTFRDAAWMLTPTEVDTIESAAREMLATIATRLRGASPRLRVQTTLLQGEAAPSLLAHVHAHPPALLVVGTHGRGFWSRLMLGSVARELIRSAPCPVLTIHAKDAEGTRGLALGRSTILVPVELEPASLRGLDEAIELAARLEWDVRILHAIAFPSAGYPFSHAKHDREWVAAATTALETIIAERAHPGVGLDFMISSTSPVRAIVEAAKNPEIGFVAMATHGRGSMAESVVGAITPEVVRMVSCPVLTLRNP